MISLTRKSIKMKTLLIIQMSTLASVIERMPYMPGENDVTQVSAGNFARAETDENIRQIAGVIEKATGRALNTWLHYRTLDSFFNPIVRQNRDTLYSMAILDTASGTLKIELPETKGRYQSVYCINQNHYQEYYATAPAIFKVRYAALFVLCLPVQFLYEILIMISSKHKAVSKIYRLNLLNKKLR